MMCRQRRTRLLLSASEMYVIQSNTVWGSMHLSILHICPAGESSGQTSGDSCWATVPSRTGFLVWFGGKTRSIYIFIHNKTSLSLNRRLAIAKNTMVQCEDYNYWSLEKIHLVVPMWKELIWLWIVLILCIYKWLLCRQRGTKIRLVKYFLRV